MWQKVYVSFIYTYMFVLEIELAKPSPQLRLNGLYLDPTGDHLLMSLVPRAVESNVQAELLYLNRKSTKIKQVISKANSYMLSGAQ